MSPILEKLILAGLAEFKSWNFGQSSSNQLFVGVDKVTIVTKIIMHDFMFRHAQLDQSELDKLFYSYIFTDAQSGEQFVYSVKPRFRNQGTEITYGEPITIDCFHVFKGSIILETVAGLYNSLVFTPIAPPIGNLNAPLGTQGKNIQRVSAPTVIAFDYFSNGEADQPFIPNGIPVTYDYRVPIDPASSDNLLLAIDPDTDSQRGNPITTIQYVSINTEVLKKYANQALYSR